jgi:serine/threonine-protein kinase
MSDGGDKPGSTGPAGRAAVDTPQRIQIRDAQATPGESAVISAADTAMALARDASASQSSSGTDTTHAASPSQAGVSTTGSGRRLVDDDDVPTFVDLVGTTLSGRYQITRKIGQGGMGAVFEATHTLIGKRVAVKVLLDKYARREAIVKRLKQEAQLASAIGHEHIIDINDFGETDDGRTFVVMEFLEGESLADCLQREGMLPENRILRIAHQIASALGAAHAKGIVHRDVKPENVFLLRRKEQDFVKVVDFGISKSLRSSDTGEEEQPRLTQTGMVLGTPLYMSPEQARGDENLDHRIDVYAVGVIMYELATGRVPFSGSNYLSVISQVLNDQPTPPRQLRPELSDEFEAITLRALEKDKTRRYQTTDEMLVDLTALLEDPTRSTERARITAPRRHPLRERRRVAIWVALVAGAAAAATVAVVVMNSGSPKPVVVADAAGVVAGAFDAAGGVPIDGAPAVEEITFQIISDPPGATLYQGGRVFCQKTPCPYLAPLDNTKIDLVLKLDGYNDTPLQIIPKVEQKRQPDLKITVTLTKPPKGKPPKVIIKRGNGNGAGSGSGGGEIDPNPYEKNK